MLCLLSQEERSVIKEKFRKKQQFVCVCVHVQQVIGQVQKKYKLVQITLPIYQLDQMSIGQQLNKMHHKHNFICHHCANYPVTTSSTTVGATLAIELYHIMFCFVISTINLCQHVKHLYNYVDDLQVNGTIFHVGYITVQNMKSDIVW